MSRPIEFRAWNGKKMLGNDEIVIYLSTGMSAPMTFEHNIIRIGDGADLELMQYTELTDKNGVKIFESDLLKIEYEDGDVVGVVRWSEGKFYTECIGDIEGYPMCFNKHYAGISEVIGSLYQPPKESK